MMAADVRVTRVGWRTTYTDLGRKGVEISGVPRGGAADQYSAAAANILVRNPRDAVLLEVIGEFGFVAPVPLLVAVTGGGAPLSIDGDPASMWTPLVVTPGQEVVVGFATKGLRTYVAIGGVMDAPRFMGSAAPDPRMGFTQLVSAGQLLHMQRTGALAGLRGVAASLLDLEVPSLMLPEQEWTIEVVPAAEHDTIPNIHRLMEQSEYRVGPQSDHVGVRLDGPIEHVDGPQIISHGVPIGAIEVTPADELILLGRYRTLTAGYPIVGVVAQADLPLLGQLSVGTTVRFRWISRQRAVERAAAQDRALVQLDQAVTTAFGSVVRRMASTWWL